MKKRWKNADEVLEWYESLDGVEKIALHAWLDHDDKRLLRHLARKVFIVRLGIIRAIRLFTTDRLA